MRRIALGACVILAAAALTACGSDPNAKACDELKGGWEYYQSSTDALISAPSPTQDLIDDWELARGVLQLSARQALMIEEIDPSFQSGLELLLQAANAGPNDEGFGMAMGVSAMTVKEYCGFQS